MKKKLGRERDLGEGFPVEIWDAYNEDGTLAGFDLVRGEQIQNGYYHLVCEAVIQHTDGEYLLMRRSFQKKVYPGKWEIGAGGSALKGEDKIQAVLREIKEETGIVNGELKELYYIVRKEVQAIYYGFILTTSCEKDSIQLQEGETIDYKWISREELIAFYDSPECPSSLKERLSGFIDSIR